ncbi:hypothetical protein NQ317_006291 [Molorchus minor]|uniref:Uncharacterized protein n=1 Tax=Molorchus minor TaxID=1323400 RepID=A0ABQ9JCX0_9CUCU|nr:hypothetical protein NQ317_006291 [Molorchus minor]
MTVHSKDLSMIQNRLIDFSLIEKLVNNNQNRHTKSTSCHRKIALNKTKLLQYTLSTSNGLALSPDKCKLIA